MIYPTISPVISVSPSRRLVTQLSSPLRSTLQSPAVLPSQASVHAAFISATRMANRAAEAAASHPVGPLQLRLICFYGWNHGVNSESWADIKLRKS